MRRLALACLIVLTAAPVSAAAPCAALWGERNAVYAEAGYCFRTARAIAAFGNANCRYDDIRDVPLSARDRAKVADITREEQQNACRD